MVFDNFYVHIAHKHLPMLNKQHNEETNEHVRFYPYIIPVPKSNICILHKFIHFSSPTILAQSTNLSSGNQRAHVIWHQIVPLAVHFIGPPSLKNRFYISRKISIYLLRTKNTSRSS